MAQIRGGWLADLFDRQTQERDGHLLAGGHQDIFFPLVGNLRNPWVEAISRLVSPAMAETTTMTSLPARFAAATFAATPLILSIEPTEEPPYFCTSNATPSDFLLVVDLLPL